MPKPETPPRQELAVVPFRGAELLAIAGASPAETLVAMKPMVEGMGLVWEGQRKKLEGHPVLGTSTTVKVVQVPGDGQAREATFLPLARVPFWLATLHPNRIADAAVREAVLAYQAEAADALFAHFFPHAGQPGAELTPKVVGGVVKRVVSCMAPAIML